MKYVTKGLLGWVECEYDSKREGIYVLQTYEEYNEAARKLYIQTEEIYRLNRQKDAAKKENEQLSEELRNYKNEVDRLRQLDANVKIAELTRTIYSQKMRIAGLQNDNLQLRKAIEELDKKNEALYRRLKIEAGKQKGILNKREHSGYTVLSCKHTRLKDRDSYGWAFRISTPFGNSTPFEEVKDRCQKELIGTDGGGYIYDCLIFDRRYPESVVNDIDFELNLREGFWETRIEVRCEIRQIPDHLLPPQKNKKKPSIDIEYDMQKGEPKLIFDDDFLEF